MPKNLADDLTSDEKRDLLRAARIAYALPAKLEELIDGIIYEREHGSSVPRFHVREEDLYDYEQLDLWPDAPPSRRPAQDV